MAAVNLRQMDASRHHMNRTAERLKNVCMQGTGWNLSRTLMCRKTI